MKPRMLVAFATLALFVSAVPAFAAGKGGSMLSIGLGQASVPVADFGSVGGDYVTPASASAITAGAEYWYLFSEDYALALSGQYGFGSQKWTPAATSDPELKARLSSFKVRVGGDRVGHVGDRLTVFMGPGLEFASSKTRLESAGSPDLETRNATFFGVNGRLGGIMKLSDNVGISGEISHSFGFASAEGDKNPAGTAKSTWTTGDFSAFWGLTFSL